jgi:hypothetical protein
MVGSPEMNTYLTICGLVLVAVGWLVSHFLSKSKDRGFERDRDRKAHLDRQLAQLYGRIYGLLMQNERLVRQIQDRTLSDEEEKIWVHALENYFLANNRRIVELITQNVDLLEGYRFPESYLRFIDYAVGLEILHKQYHDLGIAYGFRYTENFPAEFQRDVVTMVSRLKKRQWEFVGQDLPEPTGDT